jgi:hypothetical protein
MKRVSMRMKTSSKRTLKMKNRFVTEEMQPGPPGEKNLNMPSKNDLKILSEGVNEEETWIEVNGVTKRIPANSPVKVMRKRRKLREGG